MLGQEESCWCFIGVLLEAVVMSEMLVDELAFVAKEGSQEDSCTLPGG